MPVHLTIENETSLPDGGPLSYTISGKRGIDLGRDAYLDWSLPDPSKTVSGKHCEIRYRDGAYWLHDVSRNGTFLNRSSQRMQEPHRLRDGDRLEIGRYIVAVRLDGEDAQAAPSAPAAAASPTQFWGGVGEAAPPISPRDLRPARELRPVQADFRDWAIDVPTPVSGGSDHDAFAPAPPAPTERRDPAFEDLGWAQGPAAPAPAPEPYTPTPTPRRPAPSPEGASPWDAPSVAPSGPEVGWAAPPAQPAAAPQPPAPARAPEPEPFPPPLRSAPPVAEPAWADPGASPPSPPAPPSWQPPPAARPPAQPEPASASLPPENPPGNPWGKPSLSADRRAPAAEPASPAALASGPPSAGAPQPRPVGGDAAAADFVARFAKGAGISPDILGWRDPGDLAEEVGVLTRLATESVKQLLSGRAESKRAARTGSHTMIQALDNNPLKFAPTPEDAMKIMFGRPSSGYLDARRALEQSFKDLKTHQVKTYSAMQHALRLLMEDLEPATIEGSTENDRGLGALLGSRKAKLWDLYVARWDTLTSPHEDGMVDAFMMFFAECYDRGGGKT